MYKEEELFSILLVSGECFKIYKVNKAGNHVDFSLLDSRDIRLQKHHKKGGSSAPRFQRIAQSEQESYVKKVVEHCVGSIVINGIATVKGILLAGPADFKNRIRDNVEFKKYFGNIILGTVDTSEIDEHTHNMVYENNAGIFGSHKDQTVCKKLDKINEMMTLCDNKIMIGWEETVKNLENCVIKELYLSSQLDDEKKDLVNKLNTYGCIVHYINQSILLSKVGVDIVGVLYY